jgi:hypothetical protein
MVALKLDRLASGTTLLVYHLTGSPPLFHQQAKQIVLLYKKKVL